MDACMSVCLSVSIYLLTYPPTYLPTYRFYEMMRKFFGALVVGVPVNVMYKFQRQKLSLSWREWLTNRITEVGT